VSTIKDVAEKAGVSISTVSRTLTSSAPVMEETRQKVLEAVAELNYQPNTVARGLKVGRSKTLGLIIPNYQSLVFPDAIKGITDALDDFGYNLVLGDTYDNLEREEQLIEGLRMRMVDGLICSTATRTSTHLLQLKEEGFPVVLLLRHLNEDIDAVIADNYQGGFVGGNYLLNKGFTRIGFINGSLELDLYRQRYSGFQNALSAKGVEKDQRLMAHGHKGWQGGYYAMLKLLNQKPFPEAVFATSDPKAFGAIKAIHESGMQIPQDISVVGYDNLEFSQLINPPLTTIGQPFYDMGRMAAQKILELINRDNRKEAIVDKFPVELIERGSVREK